MKFTQNKCVGNDFANNLNNLYKNLQYQRVLLKQIYDINFDIRPTIIDFRALLIWKPKIQRTNRPNTYLDLT